MSTEGMTPSLQRVLDIVRAGNLNARAAINPASLVEHQLAYSGDAVADDFERRWKTTDSVGREVIENRAAGYLTLNPSFQVPENAHTDQTTHMSERLRRMLALVRMGKPEAREALLPFEHAKQRTGLLGYEVADNLQRNWPNMSESKHAMYEERAKEFLRSAEENKISEPKEVPVGGHTRRTVAALQHEMRASKPLTEDITPGESVRKVVRDLQQNMVRADEIEDALLKPVSAPRAAKILVEYDPDGHDLGGAHYTFRRYKVTVTLPADGGISQVESSLAWTRGGAFNKGKRRAVVLARAPRLRRQEITYHV